IEDDRRTRSAEAQRQLQHKARPWSQVAGGVDVAYRFRRLPCRIEREPQLETSDRSGAIGKGKVVIEEIFVAVVEQNARQVVTQLVAEWRPGKGRVGGEPAPPP